MSSETVATYQTGLILQEAGLIQSGKVIEHRKFFSTKVYCEVVLLSGETFTMTTGELEAFYMGAVAHIQAVENRE